MYFKENIKKKVRAFLIQRGWDWSSNLRNDRLTKEVFKRLLNPTSNCIDIGAHKGEVLDLFIKYAPEGRHWAFEPLPNYNHDLIGKYGDNIEIRKEALSDSNGVSEFQFVKELPAYSGLRKRSYPKVKTKVSTIEVSTTRLDTILPKEYKPDCIKLDIEGGEYYALLGAKLILKKHRPVIVMEFGLGAADHYGVSPEMMYQLLVVELGYRMFSLSAFVEERASFDLVSFVGCYEEGREYYFVCVWGN